MADGDLVPPEHHVVRYCSPREMAGDRISSANLKPRPIDLGKASTTHIECCGGASYEDNIRRAKDILAFTKTNYQGTGKLAVLQVAKINSVSTDSAPVTVIEKRTRHNPCHALITGLDDSLACEHLATVANGGDVRPAG